MGQLMSLGGSMDYRVELMKLNEPVCIKKILLPAQEYLNSKKETKWVTVVNLV